MRMKSKQEEEELFHRNQMDGINELNQLVFLQAEEDGVWVYSVSYSRRMELQNKLALLLLHQLV